MSGPSDADRAWVEVIAERYRDRFGVNCIPGWESTPRIDKLLRLIRKAWAEIKRLGAEEQKCRKALCFGHGHDGIYGDDGEMQCNIRGGHQYWDFRRTPLHDLCRMIAHERAWGEARIRLMGRTIKRLREEIEILTRSRDGWEHDARIYCQSRGCQEQMTDHYRAALRKRREEARDGE